MKFSEKLHRFWQLFLDYTADFDELPIQKIGSTMQDVPKVGQLITNGDKRRDAIHVALAPATANEDLNPGDHIGFAEEKNIELFGKCENPIGIVDPYLKDQVKKGQSFWMFLYPETVTSLRHVWTHPAYKMQQEKVISYVDSKNLP